MSIFIFSLVGVVLYYLSSDGYTKIYRNFHEHSLGYFLFSCVCMIVFHDTFFYFY
jgi:hypothetical protein